jgi:undecaprenyl pyrophosphate synthase
MNSIETIQANFSGLLRKGSAEERIFRFLDLGNLPRHVAIIMDGNGRWARNAICPGFLDIGRESIRFEKWWKRRFAWGWMR